MLTKKQSDLLRFIHERLKESGVPPSFDEMKEALDLRSKSGIHRLILALEERGFIRRLPNRARALEVLRLPDSSVIRGGQSRGVKFSPAVIEGRLGRTPAPQERREDDAYQSVIIPVMGRLLRERRFQQYRIIATPLVSLLTFFRQGSISHSRFAATQ